MGTHMQLELGVQQRAAAVVVRAGEEAEDGLVVVDGCCVGACAFDGWSCGGGFG